MGRYDYLKRFVSLENNELDNWFIPVDAQSIERAEAKIGCAFPESLRAFYLEIGCGFLRSVAQPNVPPVELINRVIGPTEAAELFLGEGEMAPPEGFRAGVLPVFEIGEDNFIVMRPRDASPDHVLRVSGRLVAESFERFIWRLYFERADFFLLSARPI